MPLIQHEYLLGRRALACLAHEDRQTPPPPGLTPAERTERQRQREKFYVDFIPVQELPALKEMADQLRRCRAAYGDAAERIPGNLKAEAVIPTALYQLAQAADLVKTAAALLEQSLPSLPYGGQKESIQKWDEPRLLTAPPAPPETAAPTAEPTTDLPAAATTQE